MAAPVDPLADLRKLDLPFDIDNVREQCHKCVRRQLKKYENFVEGDVSCKGKFTVPCKGVPKEPDLALKRILGDQWEDYLSVADPVVWAAKNIKHSTGPLMGKPWVARWYQEEVLRCTSIRRMLRIARRSGKTDMIAIYILYRLFTQEGIKAVIAAPNKSHVEEIMQRVSDFAKSNPDLRSCILRERSAPYYEFTISNKSRLRGFAVGAQGGSEGVGIRGQDADEILCLPRGTLVSTSKFAVKPIERLTLQDTVLGGDQYGVRVGEIQQLGVRRATVMTIPTALGVVKCTPEHPLFDGEKDVEARCADHVITSLYYQKLTFSPRVIIARLLGYVYGDGWVSEDKVGFSGQEADLEQIQADLSLLGDKKHIINTRVCENERRGTKGEGSQFGSGYAYHFIKGLCPTGRKVFQPLRVPDRIMNGIPYVKMAFLSGLFSAEGTGIKYQTNKKTPRTVDFAMRSTKEQWIRDWIGDLCLLLDSLKIKYSTSFEYFKDEDIVDPEDDGDRYIGQINIANSQRNLQKFIDKIGYCYNAEKTATANAYRLFRHYKRIWKADRWKKNRMVRMQSGTASKVAEKLQIPKSTVKYHRNLYDELYSEPLLLPHEYLAKITWRPGYVRLPIRKENIRYDPEIVDVYNLTSGADNRFFAGGMLTHNCEEMDYIDTKALMQAVLPILQTRPTTAFTGFSTPSGLKTTFYTLCEESPDYIEFHHSYKVLPPEHRASIERDKPKYTEDEFGHEFLAEWGNPEEGVYKASYIDRALRNYTYEDQVYNIRWQYVMGTDWNEQHGTEIVVLGRNPANGQYQPVDAICIEKSEFTQLAGIDAVIKMNQKWKPSFIYIDAGGGGSSNWEVLIKTSKGHRVPGGDPDTARIVDILKKYDAGASIETKHLITGEPVRRPAKQFMVNASVRMFEQGMMRISAADKTLEKQLRNYIIKRISPQGVPVYDAKDPKVKDHRLDAFNMACAAFVLEFGDLHKVDIITSAIAAPSPLSKQLSFRASRGDQEHGPEDRRIDKPESLLGRAVLPGRIDIEKRQVYRHGFSTDEEDKYRQMYARRRRNRLIRQQRYERPQRSNF